MTGHYSNKIQGGCHCGNVSLALLTNKKNEDFTPRTCQCSLCKQHGASWISDPDGEAVLTISDKKNANFYRFGHKTSDFVVCKNCGVLTIALCELDGKTKAVLNITAMKDETFSAPEILTNFDDENVEGRLARRTQNWTGNVVIK